MRLKSTFILLVCCLVNAGCYVYQTVHFTVLDAETEQPLRGANVQVSYSPWMYRPRDVEARTNEWGVTKLRVANFDGSAGGVRVSCPGYQDHWGGDFNELPRWPFRDATLHLYRNPRPEVVIVLPNDFRGEIDIFEPYPRLVHNPPGQRLYEFHVRPGTTTVLSGVPPLPRAPSGGISFTAARYEDGRVLHRSYEFWSQRWAAADEIAVRYLIAANPGRDGNLLTYLVGTGADLAEARRRRGLPLPVPISRAQTRPATRTTIPASRNNSN